MLKPLVSIIIPVYNGSNYVREAIDSALAQTYKNVEVIVVNDGSKDDGATDRIVREYGDRIRYYTKENGGVSSALNMGIREMTGDYFSWLSHDDAYESYKIESQVALLNQCEFPERTLIYCACTRMDRYSQPLNDRRGVFHYTPNKLYSANEVLYKLLRRCTFNGCSLLIPRAALIECGMFNEHLRFCQDAFMWYRIFMKDYSLLCTDEVCVKSRVHAGQLTQRGQSLFKKECEEISDILASEFSQKSTVTDNFLKAYLLSDAKFFSFRRVKAIVASGKEKRLISFATACKVYIVCMYGKIRPLIRKMYYMLFKRIKTA